MSEPTIVFCAGQAWDGFRGSHRHISERLTKYADVLYVEPAISPLTPFRRNSPADVSVLQPRFHRETPRLSRWTPMVLPGRHRPAMKAIGDVLVRRSVSRAIRRVGGDVKAVIVGNLEPLLDVSTTGMRVQYVTDDYTAGAGLMGVSQEQLAQREAVQLAAADVVVTCSAALQDHWSAKGARTELITNGVDVDVFRDARQLPRPADVTVPSPVAGFIGHISERIDIALLEAVADRGISLLLIGRMQRTFDPVLLEGLLARPNVQWLGPRPFEQLPAYLGAMQVGLLPYTDSEFNKASFPLKLLEYLAAGIAAVSTDLPAVEWLDTDLIDVASTPSGFAQAVAEAVEQPSTDLVAQRQSLAAVHSWDHKVERLANLIGVGPGSSGPAD